MENAKMLPSGQAEAIYLIFRTISAFAGGAGRRRLRGSSGRPDCSEQRECARRERMEGDR